MSSNPDQLMLVPAEVSSVAPTHTSHNSFWKNQIIRPPTPCEGPGCSNVVPEQLVSGHRRGLRFCSRTCANRFQYRREVIGTCPYCSGPVRGCSSKKRKFCCREHRFLFLSESLLRPTGPFRPFIEAYMLRFSGTNRPHVKGTLCRFFKFAVTKGAEKLHDVKPSMVRDFIAQERARGVRCGVDVSNLSTFFNDCFIDEVVDRNPVRRGMRDDKGERSRFPFTEREMETLWDAVCRTGSRLLMAAFAIAEEAGLRNTEICNILISDVDLEAQTIFVRHPLKKGFQRKVPFGSKAKQAIENWLKQRDPRCSHGYLLHHTRRGKFFNSLLLEWFKKAFRQQERSVEDFILHRLRHTWASRLVNAGMALPVLQVLGGWRCLRSVQWYAKLRQETIQREFEAAYRKLEEHHVDPAEEVMSMADFLAMEDDSAANVGGSAL